MARKKLSAEEIETALVNLSGWTMENKKLKKRLQFNNFAESLDFVNRVGAIAEAKDHHPDINFGWGYAEFFITTHDAGGITERDFDLAKAIENLQQ